jgi:parvulin-like peptidyl-prolyl isomerase
MMWEAQRKSMSVSRVVTLAVMVVLTTAWGGGAAFAFDDGGAPLGAQSQAQEQITQAAAPAQQIPVEPEDGGLIDRILVRVNGEAILHSEFDAVFSVQLAAIEGRVSQEELEAQMPQLRVAQLAGMIDELMVQQRAGDLGITADANDIDRAMANLMEANGITSQEQLEQLLAADGMSLGELRESIRDNLIRSRLLYDQVQRQLFVSEREIVEYYELNKVDFTQPAQVMFQQIIFMFQEGRANEEMLRIAQAAVAELHGGVAVSAVAGKYEGAQLVPGGDWVPIEDLQPSIAAAVEGMTPNTYSDPIEGRFGYHVIQLMDLRQEVIQSLEEVQMEVRNILTQRKSADRLEDYVSELRAISHLEVFDPTFEDVEAQWNAPTANAANRQQ